MTLPGISGSLAVMPLTDLLQWAQQARQTGTLLIHGERYTKKILLRQGLIVSSSSDDPTEHLGHFLLSHDRVTEAELKRALETQQRTNVMLGKILVTVGVIEESELKRMLVQKAEETIFGLFLWPDARFEFVAGNLPREIMVPLSLRVEDVLLKGVAWFDELQHIRKEFASSRTILARSAKPLPPEFQGSRSLARRIVELVDGKRCIAEICLQVHASEFTVSKLLYLMHKQGFLQVTELVAASTPTPHRTLTEMIEEARAALKSGRVEQALAILEEAAPLSPHDLALRSLRDEARSEFVRQVTANGLGPDRVPSLLKPLERLTGESLHPEEVFILSRVDGTWDIRSIVSLCPFPEADALLHMKRLQDRGILALSAPS